MLADYNIYGDVVIDDFTFSTNRFNKSLFFRVGIDNEYKTVIFCFAIVEGEKEESLLFIHNSFLEAVNYKYPEVIFTDESTA